MKIGNATKNEWIEWIKNELEPPHNLTEINERIIKAFLAVLQGEYDDIETRVIFEKCLCWTENNRATFLRPEWVRLSDYELYIYTAVIEAVDKLTNIKAESTEKEISLCNQMRF